MLSEKFSHFLDKPLSPLAKAFPVNPNIITFIGMIITSSSGFVIPFNLFLGGILILAGGVFDLIDGIVARVNGRTTKFGALFDSTLDRIADGFIFLGIAWHFFNINDDIALYLTILCMIASFLISYVRARAEGLGISCNVGIIERPERLIFLAFGCLTGLLFPILLVLTILSWATVIQRIFHAKKQFNNLHQ
ncbi:MULTISPECIES: CDP-alcohol phosphatidyltransferase family protein [Thermodesulfovibrio]|uniref:CDP-alcohol phosphatidyltransferase family protein n=1 Tax=Thermodesulfovibrio yellowstonii (strain ATCC 51303 / DSM 11347 / YP87) TaxID=289376 RepID=B5YFZ6_THEYD|nr:MULTISPECIES: CDP-alcohol phosphatidyltransferase family protein [Thermodesulfovibrio]ACI21167.1 CDP-alcohol phosphatidyltransferase family protein [Thermodesulfovibrio yellowstonii DSM 11347]MDI6865825.1 CDP-alcohol phosphatidyltransferase family protein [Thermodesulfovibrio yellowstonii]